jgi:WD40 repeat protein
LQREEEALSTWLDQWPIDFDSAAAEGETEGERHPNGWWIGAGVVGVLIVVAIVVSLTFPSTPSGTAKTPASSGAPPAQAVAAPPPPVKDDGVIQALADPPPGPVGDRAARGTPSWEPSPLDQLDPARIPPEERGDGPPGRLVAVGDIPTRPGLMCPGKGLCVAYSPDGRRLVSGHEDGNVNVWDAEGRKVTSLAGFGGLMGIAFSADGQSFLATGMAREDRAVSVRAWHFDGHDRYRDSLLASLPDGKASGAQACAAGGPTCTVAYVSGSPPADQDHEVRVYEVWEGEPAGWPGLSRWALQLGWWLCGPGLALLVLLYKVGLPIAARWDPLPRPGRHAIRALIVTAAGLLLLGLPLVVGYHLSDGREQRAVLTVDENVKALALTPDGRHLAIAADGLRLWDVRPEPTFGAVLAAAWKWPFGCLLTLAALLVVTAHLYLARTGLPWLAWLALWLWLAGCLVALAATGEGHQVLLAGAIGMTLVLTAGAAFLRRGTPASSRNWASWCCALLTCSGLLACLILLAWGEAARTPGPLPLPDGCPETATALAFSADGRTLAVATSEREVKLVRLGDAPGPDDSLAARHDAEIRGLAVEPDGRSVATAAGSVLRVWNADAPRRLLPWGAAHYSRRSRLLADGRTLAHCDFSGDLNFWDLGCPVPTRRASLHLLPEEEWGTEVWFAPRGKTVAVHPEEDGSVRLWDVSRTPPVALDLVSPGDGLTSHERHAPLFASLKSSRESGRPGDLEPLQRFWSAAIVFAPSAKMLLHYEEIKGKPVQRLLEIDGEKIEERLKLEGYGAAAFSPDGRALAAAHEEGHIRLWDLAGGKAAERVCFQALPRIRQLRFAPDGNALAAYGKHLRERRGDEVDTDAGYWELWDLAGPEPRRRARFRHPDPVEGVLFSADGRTAVTSERRMSADSLESCPTGRVWDLSGERPREWLTLRGRQPVGLALGDTALVTLGEDQHIRLYDTGDGREVAAWPSPAEWEVSLGWMPFAEIALDGRHLIVRTREWARPWNWHVYRLWPDPPPGRTLADYDKQLKATPDRADLRLGRAQALLWRGRYAEALADLDAALAADDRLVEAHWLRGLVRAARQDHDGAIADFGAVIRLDPKHARAYQQRGLARAARGEFTEAKTDLDEAFRRDPALAPRRD